MSFYAGMPAHRKPLKPYQLYLGDSTNINLTAKNQTDEQHILIFKQRNTINLTSGQFGLTSRHSSQRNKKIKTPPPHIWHTCFCPTSR